LARHAHHERFTGRRSLVRGLHNPRGIASEIGHGDFVVADDFEAERRARLRAAIRRHLQRFPLAGDTRDGIVASWLPPRGYEDAPQLIDAVLAAMVAASELAPRHLPGGRVLYVRGPALEQPDEPPAE
jgi:hypothetical protein